MITGDDKLTATSIGREIGLLKGSNDLILTSEELNRLSDEEISIKIKDIKIIARVLPTDKSRLVRICQKNN